MRLDHRGWISLGDAATCLSVFPFRLRQFFILDSAEMFANFTDAVKRVAEFAGLPAYDFRYTTGHEFKSVCETQQWPEEPDFFAPQGM